MAVEVEVVIGTGHITRGADRAAELIGIRSEESAGDLAHKAAHAFIERDIGVAVQPGQRRRELTITVDLPVGDAEAARRTGLEAAVWLTRLSVSDRKDSPIQRTHVEIGNDLH